MPARLSVAIRAHVPRGYQLEAIHKYPVGTAGKVLEERSPDPGARRWQKLMACFANRMDDVPMYWSVPEFISADQLEELRLLLQLDDSDGRYVESHVYNRVEKQNVMNKHLRSSRKIEYTDPAVFDWVDQRVLQPLARELGDQLRLVLVRNDIEVVKYNEGDFFKKHQDYVNFDSNEFKNYTLIMCLQGCEEGGETVLYAPDGTAETVPETGRSPGSLLLFRKETVHEGREILKGTKQILKANVLCYRDSPELGDLIVVSLSKAPGRQYVIPVRALEQHPTCVYRAFYNFRREAGDQGHVLHYREDQLTDAEFRALYERLVPASPSARDHLRSLDYAGLLPAYRRLAALQQFCHDSSQTFFPCSVGDYYELIKCQWEGLWPVQVLTFETEGQRLVVWCGTHDNRLVTCDLHIVGENGWEDELADCSDDSETEAPGDASASASASQPSPDPRLTDEEWDSFQKAVNRATTEFKLDGDAFFPRRAHDRDGHESCPLRNLVLWEVWERFGLRPLAECSSAGGPGPEGLRRYASALMDDVSKREGHDGSNAYRMAGDRRYQLIDSPDTTEQQYAETGEPFDADRFRLEVDPAKLVDVVMRHAQVSGLNKAQSSEYHCNETYYVTYDVVFRVGFVKAASVARAQRG